MPSGYTTDNQHYFRTRAQLAAWQAAQPGYSPTSAPARGGRKNRWNWSPSVAKVAPPSAPEASREQVQIPSDPAKALAFRLAGIGTAGDSGTPEFWTDEGGYHLPTPRATVVDRRRHRHDKYTSSNEVVFVSAESKHPEERNRKAERGAQRNFGACTTHSNRFGHVCTTLTYLQYLTLLPP